MNAAPSLQGALWYGNTQLATKLQLLSTSTGLYSDIQNANFSTINVSTLNVPQWVSTPLLYVSDIQGYNVNIYQDISANQGIFNITNVSVMQLTFKPTFSGNIQVTFDLGLGQAIGGFLAGLGAAVGGALIGVGTGAGLAIQGAEQGIATLIAGRPQNFITQNTYETINFTSQLQISTLGNDFPAYSTVFRTVSSVSANSVPGPEMFTSTIFYPGQICIRSVSDPFNLITGDSNLNTSTIQSFGQWVPLEGLEPENIVANSVSTNSISTGTIDSGFAGIDVLVNEALVSKYIEVGKPGVPGLAYFNYESPLEFELGSGKYAAIIGDVNQWNYQTDGDIVFSQIGDPNTIPVNARLQLGTQANESILTVSSINAAGNIQANSGFISSLTVFDLTIVSSLSTVYNQSNVNILSTSEVYADFLGANTANISSLQISSITPFQMKGILGNPTGPFDITRNDSLTSTSYVCVSSLTQNILNYSLNIGVQDEANFNIYNGQSQLALYSITPQNITQWASTNLIFNTYEVPGQIDLGSIVQWGVSPGSTQGIAPGGATFDVTYTYSNGYANSFLITEEGQGSFVSTFYNYPGPTGFTGLSTFRFTLPPIVSGSRSGWWQMTTPAGAPYASSNNNTFQIYQDINDTFITASDRLHLQAGDIFLDGSLNLSNFTANTVIATTINGSNGFFDNLSTGNLYTSTLFGSNVYGSQFVSTQQYVNSYSYTGSVNAAPNTQPLAFSYNLNSTDFTNIRTLNVPSRGPNMFNSWNLNEWNNTQWNTPTGTNTTTGGPQIYLGELIPTTGFAYGPAKFWINNTATGGVACPVSVVRSGGWLSSIGVAPTSGTGYSLIQTPNGTNWSITCNVPQPQGAGGVSYSNTYNLQMNEAVTQLNVGMPYTEVVSGTKTTQANKVLMAANQIRTICYGSPSFSARECGFELTSYFDANVIFSGSQSDAINNIISPAGSLGYAVVAWSPQIWFGRIRTQSYGIQGFEVEAVVSAISGTFGDLIWASHRYLNVIDTTGLSADIREIYFMVPCNYMTYENLIGPY